MNPEFMLMQMTMKDVQIQQLAARIAQLETINMQLRSVIACRDFTIESLIANNPSAQINREFQQAAGLS